MRNRVALALALSVLALLVGCGGKGSKLVGNWTTNMGGMPADVTFNADGTGTIDLTINQAPVTGAKVAIKATYKEDGDKLHMTLTDASVSNLPEALKGHEKEFVDKMKEGMEVGKEHIEAMKWTGDTSFTTTDDKGKTTTFTKK